MATPSLLVAAQETKGISGSFLLASAVVADSLEQASYLRWFPARPLHVVSLTRGINHFIYVSLWLNFQLYHIWGQGKEGKWDNECDWMGHLWNQACTEGAAGRNSFWFGPKTETCLLVQLWTVWFECGEAPSEQMWAHLNPVLCLSVSTYFVLLTHPITCGLPGVERGLRGIHSLMLPGCSFKNTEEMWK